MKRLVICCDGTWQGLGNEFPTNIAKIAQAVRPSDNKGIAQIVYYDEGIGTFNFSDKLMGGAMGEGIDMKISEAYRFLVLNWEPGDEIYFFGFSRGAYTVRSLGGLIRKCGILKGQFLRKIPNALNIYRDRQVEVDSEEAKRFRTNYSDEGIITSIGCFDTVGSLGIPDQLPFLPFDNWINKKYQFHDCQLGKIILNAFHALAVDECRKVFLHTPMEKSPNNPNQNLQQTWFVGDHSSIGGGAKKTDPLATITLSWMFEKIKEAGLGLQVNEQWLLNDGTPDPMIDFVPDMGATGMFGKVDREIVGGLKVIHPTVVKRWENIKKYRPKPLQKILK
jgi:uncharacterized protein (DUF2235 family)